MKRGLVFVLALAACSPQHPPTQITEASAATNSVLCQATSARDWSAVGSQYYVIEANAEGASCNDATAVMRIETVEGAVLFERAYPVAQISLAFNPSNDQTGLRSDLEGWTQNSSQTATADSLPPWPAGASQPPGFTPAVSRGRYEAARGAQGPLFCFPDSATTHACVALAGAQATLLGSLTADLASAPQPD